MYEVKEDDHENSFEELEEKFDFLRENEVVEKSDDNE